MSKADRLKEEIGWLKTMLALLVAVGVSMVAWVVQRYEVANLILVIICCVLIVLDGAAIIYVNRAAYRRMKDLEDV